MLKNYIVSDLHGQMEIYKSIKKYLNNVDDEVCLYINGDVIDRGYSSIEMLLNIIYSNDLKIIQLAGNHELMMLDFLLNKEDIYLKELWLSPNNGGKKTYNDFHKLSDKNKELIINYLKKLKLSIVLNKKIMNYSGITITHAYPMKNFSNLNKTLNDAITNYSLRQHLWNRIEDLYYYDTMGVDNYLNIIGHTYNIEDSFIVYDNVINIDGGAAVIPYLKNPKDISVPLVEINYEDNLLNILGFNCNGEITFNKKVIYEDKLIIKK